MSGDCPATECGDDLMTGRTDPLVALLRLLGEGVFLELELFGLFGELGFGRSSERRFTKSRSFSRIFAGFDFKGT